jgi:hypothetical protein
MALQVNRDEESGWLVASTTAARRIASGSTSSAIQFSDNQVFGSC